MRIVFIMLTCFIMITRCPYVYRASRACCVFYANRTKAAVLVLHFTRTSQPGLGYPKKKTDLKTFCLRSATTNKLCGDADHEIAIHKRGSTGGTCDIPVIAE